jgi:glycosyltransferase involved in cell wall biosynthesis
MGAPLPVADERMPALFDDAYLLTMLIPFYRDPGGQVWLDRLWYRDLKRHFSYLPRLRLAAPQLEKGDQPDLVALSDEDLRRVRFVPLPPLRSKAEFLRHLPATLGVLWRAIGEADTVHSGIHGWPFPLAWAVNVIALLRKRKLVLVIESAPWRLNESSRKTLVTLVRHHLTERMGRWMTRRADLVVATHHGYLRSLAPHARGITLVTPASWVDEEDLLSAEAAAHAWQRKQAAPAKLAFVGRLVAEKGVRLLLDAARQLSAAGGAPQIDIIGQGELRDECARAARELPFVHLLEPVPYGEPLFNLLRQYHAVIVPSLSDEQPRIIYDAYSQAVPVIASDTEGNRDDVADGSTGWLFPAGDAAALARRLLDAGAQGARLAQMGMQSLQRARQTTHAEMHRKRAEILQLLRASPCTPSANA